MTDLLNYFMALQPDIVAELTELVNYETPSHDKALVDQLGVVMQAKFKALGASSVTVIPQRQVGDFVLAKWHEDAPGLPILFLMHIDTVWPEGTLAGRPVTEDGEGRLYGPGALDMKGGIAVVLAALRGLAARGEMPNRPIWILMNTDEEIGSVHSGPVIVETARQCGLVLVMEPATPEGALKTWRKGVASYDVTVKGRASHAGNAPEEGINAIVDLAQQIMELNSMNDLRHGTSVSVTMVNGGIATNVIPEWAAAKVDVRTLTALAFDDVDARIMGLSPFVPGAQVTVERHHARGPMERNTQMIAAFRQAQTIAAGLGLTIREDGAGGGSDGNLTAYEGITTLDGLGPQGEGLHAVHEHLLVGTLSQRAALIAGMLRDWAFE